MAAINESISASTENSETFTCTDLLNNLAEQLQAQMDVNSEYILLQRELERTHSQSIQQLDAVAKRTENIDKKWRECIDETIAVRDQIVRDVEVNALYATERMTNPQSEAEMRQKIRQSHQALVNGLSEIKELSDNVESFHSKTQYDQRRLHELESKIIDVQNLDKNIMETLEREIDVVKQIRKSSREEENVYGICELTTSYKQLLRHLGTTLKALESLKAQSAGNATPISTVSVEELENLIKMFRSLVKIIKSKVDNTKRSNAPSSSGNGMI